MTIQIKPVAGRIGAQLDGIKLGGDISAQAFEFINEARRLQELSATRLLN